MPGENVNKDFEPTKKHTSISEIMENLSDVELPKPANSCSEKVQTKNVGFELKQSFVNRAKAFTRRKHEQHGSTVLKVSILFAFIAFFVWATVHHINLSIKCDDKIDFKSDNETIPKTSNGCESFFGIQWCHGYGMLLLITICIVWTILYYNLIKPYFGKQICKNVIDPVSKILAQRSSKLTLMGVLLILLLAYLIYDLWGSYYRLQSLLGIFLLYGAGYVFSSDRKSINWRPVINGIAMQFLLGLFCIRLEFGRNVFQCFGNKTAEFLNYANVGSEFVFGEELVYDFKVFAFSVLTVIFFFSFIISVLYYYGVMQIGVQKIGWVLQSILGTTVCESITAAGNIFLGMSESPLLIRPYIKLLTASELHAIMASGFATVSGSVLAAYIRYGAEPAHLITSSVMAAPAALAFSKLFYPETEESKTKADNIAVEKSKDSSALDAATNGAMTAIGLVLGIIANLIAFVSFVAFLNGLVGWLGVLVGFDDLSFQKILAKLFIPLAYILGISWEDSENVGKVVALKSIINEFVAYQELGKLKENHLISLRSSAIATFAICGFANPSSLGIMIGNLSTMCPEQRENIMKVSIRSWISGAVICFINASIAALLMPEDMFTEA